MDIEEEIIKRIDESVNKSIANLTSALTKIIDKILILLIVTIILLFTSNLIWLYEWNQYDYISYEQDGEGVNSINTGEMGDLINESEITCP